MIITRRVFMRQFGATLAGLLASGCRTCYLVVETVIVERPSGTLGRNPQWRALRACWLDLKDSRLQSSQDTDFTRGLRQRHEQAIQALETNRELPAAVADAMRMAFEEAIAHIQWQRRTCYDTVIDGIHYSRPPVYDPRESLMSQATTLTEMAQRSAIETDTVARARDALEQDMAWLALFQAGKEPWKQKGIQATPAEAEAARILVELLLRKE